MNSRPNRSELYLYIAYAIAERGTCPRKKAGAVITSSDNRIISTGYNGPPKGSPSCTCDITNPCERAIHAEANAIYAAAKFGIKLTKAIMYCTDSPCIKCAEAILQSGITEFYYSKLYRDPKGLYLLKENNINILPIALTYNFHESIQNNYNQEGSFKIDKVLQGD